MTPSPPWFVHTFLRLWAVAHIIHLCIATNHHLDAPWNIVTVVAAFAVVARPGDLRLLVVMAVAQLVDLVAEMPVAPDHWILLGLGNLALLVSLAVQRELSLPALERGLPAVRAITLVTYTAAAVAKQNSTFIDPAASCARAIARTASYGLSDHASTNWIWVVSVLLTEASIPVLLLVPRTRRHGVRVALAFHFVLSASPAFGVVDFTAALYAVFFLFLPTDDARAMLDLIARATSRSAIARDVRQHPVVASCILLAVLGFSGYVAPSIGTGATYVLAELFLLGILLAALLTWRRSPGVPRAFGRVPLATLPVLLLAALWVISPYLGSRTTGVFTMFSSLRTEAGVANHLWLPHTHLTSWQEDLVTLDSSNDATLDRAADRDLAVPLLQLRIMAADDPELVVTGRLDGRTVTFGPGADQRHLDPPSLWERSFLWFRPVPVGDRPFCSVS
ncbi:MAG TPA: hypothetical protein VNS81_06750 [Nocardioides sp.]|nr:hypothetical protein [Nocardioides sp.]